VPQGTRSTEDVTINTGDRQAVGLITTVIALEFNVWSHSQRNRASLCRVLSFNYARKASCFVYV